MKPQFKPEEIYIDLSKLSEEQRKYVGEVTNIDKIQKFFKTFPYLFFDNRFSAWNQCIHHDSDLLNAKTELTYDSVTPDFIKSIYEQKICCYCKEYTPKKYRTLEHKLPLKRGGRHSSHNIVMACLSCNCSKGKMTEQEFKMYKNNE